MSVYRPAYTDKKTGEVRRQEIWWYGFVYAGKRYQESSGTTRKSLAVEAEKKRRLELERQFTTGRRAADPRLMLRTVKDAIETYVAKYDFDEECVLRHASLARRGRRAVGDRDRQVPGVVEGSVDA